MAKKIQHLRGTRTEYEEANITPYEGEIAIEEREGGGARIKVGDGKTPYLSLPYLDRTIVHIKQSECEYVSLTLQTGHEYRLEMHSSIELSLPETIDEDFSSVLVFDTSIGTPSFTYPKTIVFIGDDTESGLFLPKPRKRYTITIDNRTHAIYARVNGASHDLAYKAYHEIKQKSDKLSSLVAFENPDTLLDISIGGYVANANTDGYVEGLGGYDIETGTSTISMLFRNAYVCSFEEASAFLKKGCSYTSQFAFFQEEGACGFSASCTFRAPFATYQYHSFPKPFNYHLHLKICLVDSGETYEVDEEIQSPILVYYKDTSNEYLPMRHLGENVFVIDYTSPSTKQLNNVFVTGIGKTGVVKILEEDFSFVATKDGFTPPSAADMKVCNLVFGQPLYGLGYTYDTLSLSSSTVTRNFYAGILSGYKIYDDTNYSYVIFSVDLPVEMHESMLGKLYGFNECYDEFELGETEFGFFFDPSLRKLLFSGSYDVYTVEEMEMYIMGTFEATFYIFQRATPLIEKIEVDTDFHIYHEYTAITLPYLQNGTVIVKYYDENTVLTEEEEV